MYDFQKSFVPGRTGYRIFYRSHEVNHCPSCGKSQWLVGRLTAECAFCATALPLVDGVRSVGTWRPGRAALAPLAA